MGNNNPDVQKALTAAKNALIRNNTASPSEKDSKRIYISVPITDNPNYRAEAQAAQDMLLSLGHRPINPVKLVDALPHLAEVDFVLKSLQAMIVCDGIYMCKGWEQSKKCTVELAFAEYLKYRNPEFILRGEI